MGKRLSSPLQEQHAKRLFDRLNPGVDPQEIDWTSFIGSEETYHESLESLASAYPQFTWQEDVSDPTNPGFDPREEMVEALRDRLPENYEIIKKRKLSGLLRKEKQLDKQLKTARILEERIDQLLKTEEKQRWEVQDARKKEDEWRGLYISEQYMTDMGKKTIKKLKTEIQSLKSVKPPKIKLPKKPGKQPKIIDKVKNIVKTPKKKPVKKKKKTGVKRMKRKYKGRTVWKGPQGGKFIKVKGNKVYLPK